jgi:hypothetical protein
MQTSLTAYAADCRVSGRIALPDDERLTDYLNREGRIALRGARLVGHEDGRIVEVDELELDREDLVAVEAHEQRGEPARRLHTVRHRIELRIGPYAVLGHLHTMPGSAPLSAIGRRPVMIPLTNATIAWSEGGQLRARDIATLIVNRDQVEWVRDGIEEAPSAAATLVAGLP